MCECVCVCPCLKPKIIVVVVAQAYRSSQFLITVLSILMLVDSTETSDRYLAETLLVRNYFIDMGVYLFQGYRNLDNSSVNMARNTPPKHPPET